MQLGSIMGSGGIIVIDDTSSILTVARFFMEFSMEESCGKCIPCRVGTTRIYNLLNKFIQGEAVESDLDELEDICSMVAATSLCGLGKAAPNPVLSSLRYFRSEYEAKIRKPQIEAIPELVEVRRRKHINVNWERWTSKNISGRHSSSTFAEDREVPSQGNFPIVR
jgi:hypothetical protein